MASLWWSQDKKAFTFVHNGFSSSARFSGSAKCCSCVGRVLLAKTARRVVVEEGTMTLGTFGEAVFLRES